jgi:hypothetical protein
MDRIITKNIIQDDDTYEPSIWRLFFDPFEIGRYNSTFKPNSRSYHTDLWDKCVDTFQVLDGGTTVWLPKDQWKDQNIPLSVPDVKTRPGLFDYLTLGIFRFLHLLWFASGMLFFHVVNKTRSTTDRFKLAYGALAVLLAIPFGVLSIIHFIGNGIIRHVSAIAATIVLFPVIILSHAITQSIKFIAGRLLGNTLDKLPETKIYNSTDGLSQHASLLKALKDTSITNARISIYNNKITFKRQVRKVEENVVSYEYLNVGHTFLIKLSLLRQQLAEFNPYARKEEGYNLEVRR